MNTRYKAAAILGLWFTAGMARATLPEPDNVLYGIIYLGTNQVTSTMSHIVVEARRNNGDVVASYRMGENPDFGDRYSIDIGLESLDPTSTINPGVIDTNASASGTSLTLVVIDADASQLLYQTNYLVGERGLISEFDFGSPLGPSPMGYDAFAMEFGLPPDSQDLDTDGDGASNYREFIAGTHPIDPDDAFKLTISQAGPEIDIVWVARQALGPGYEGASRFYSLESATNVSTGPWIGVPGYTNVLGQGQIILFTRPATNETPLIYRGRVWLDAP